MPDISPELASVVWPTDDVAKRATLKSLKPWVLAQLLAMLEQQQTLDEKVALALVDTAIHFGMAVEATARGFAQISAPLPLQVVTSLASDYNAKFRTNFSQQAALQSVPWSAIRANVLGVAAEMGSAAQGVLASPSSATPAAIAASVKTATDQVAAQCQANLPPGSGILCI